jgi:phosphohistidine phosphatase
MIKELLLLRHGKSDWSSGLDDEYRPLKDRGKRGAQRMGAWLSQENLLPDFVVSSPAVRAIETAEKAVKAMGLDPCMIHTDQRIYLAEVNDLLSVINETPRHAKRILLVGHNPGLESLLFFLADSLPREPENGKWLPTAALARFEMPASWQPGDEIKTQNAHLLLLKKPSDLARKFPFPGGPGPEGKIELRDRPAYYYTQSSVIPYRWKENKLQLLLVTSSKNKHWVVPKGIVEPGLSPQLSAAKEAEEEAGIKGVVAEQELGFYRYEKWGALCEVHVYAMNVKEVIADENWEESHRQRRWVDLSEAQDLLKQKQLLPMLDKLEKQLL